MDLLNIAIAKRVLARYDELIEALEDIYEDDKVYALSVTGLPITEEITKRMEQAKDNLRRLEIAKAERDMWLESYPLS